MKKIWICFVAMATIFLSCQNNEEIIPPAPEEKWRIAEMLNLYNGNTYDTAFFEYNEEGYVKSIRKHDVQASAQPRDTIHITWNGNKIQKVDMPSPVYPGYKMFFYTGDKVTKVLRYSGWSFNLAHKDSATYENGKMTALYSFGGNMQLISVIRLTWTGNNVTREDHYSINEDGSEVIARKVVSTYSNKPGRSELIKGEVLFWLVDSLGFHGLSGNAVATQVVTDYLNSFEVSSTYSYLNDAMDRLIETSIERQNTREGNSSHGIKYKYVDVE